MRRRPLRWLGDPLLWFVATAVLTLKCTPTQAQQPDGRGEVRLERADGYPGFTPDNPIADEWHVRNEGGSDGAGLCVISSLVECGLAQGVPQLRYLGTDQETGDPAMGKGSVLWRAAKGRSGGYYPEKLEALLQETMPGVGWASHETADTGVLDRLSRAGYRAGITMNTGGLYGYGPIAHMVSLEHYQSGGWAMVQDNNEPGIHRLMPAEELDRRFVDPQTGVGWLVFWTRLEAAARSMGAVGWGLFLTGLGVLALGTAWAARRSSHAAAFGLLVLILPAFASPAKADGRGPVGGVYDMYPQRGTSSPQAAVVPEVIRPKWLNDSWTLTRFPDGRFFYWSTINGFACFARPTAWGDRLPGELPPPAPDWRTTGVVTGQLRPQQAGHSATNDPSIAPLLMGPSKPAHVAHAANQPCPGPGPCPVKPVNPAPAPVPIPVAPSRASSPALAIVGWAMAAAALALLASIGVLAARRR